MPGGRNTTYSKEQWRVWKRNQRARPNRGKCAKCGRPATDWAHSGSSVKGPVTALCRGCHSRKDNLAGLHRPGGN